MRIALLGYGTVGKGFTEMIDQMNTHQLVKILRRNQSQLIEPRMCTDIEEIVQDPTIDIVVEVMSGVEPSYTYVRKALVSGKHVVSANKAMIAIHQMELHALSNAHQVQFRYEASCGGGIPWLMSITKAQRIDTITSFRGILNGTCNFILDEMSQSNLSFEEALKKAQNAGFAETDPSDDISGMDTLRKALISARIAFQQEHIQSYNPLGIQSMSSVDIHIGKQMGCCLKLIAYGYQQEGYSCVFVEPTFVPTHYMEASIHAQYNMVTMHGETIGNLAFSGQGAGGFPTANALCQDIMDIDDGNIFNPIFHTRSSKKEVPLYHHYILRTTLDESIIQQIFHGYVVESGNGNQQRYYLLHQLPVSFLHTVKQQLSKQDAQCFIARIISEDL